MKILYRRTVGITLLGVIFLAAGTVYYQASTEKPFKIVDKKENRAVFPVLQLIANLKNNNWPMLGLSFLNEAKAKSFENSFEMTENSGGIFESLPVFFDIIEKKPLSKDKYPRYAIKLKLYTSISGQFSLTLMMTTAYNDAVGQYLYWDYSF